MARKLGIGVLLKVTLRLYFRNSDAGGEVSGLAATPLSVSIGHAKDVGEYRLDELPSM